MSPAPAFRLSAVCAAVLVATLAPVHAQTTAQPEAQLPTVVIRASADASAEGLSKPYAGGQVARGGRAGIRGTRDAMETPFSITAYTAELIQNQQAKSIADVLQNDPSVRVARGFGNYQESYFVRGFILNSDEVAYNGLYSLLPRQYVAAELFERVEVLRGASTFLTGASPTGNGIGGSINLLPKRAPNEPLNQVTVGVASGSQWYGAADIARRFGPDKAAGIRFNVARRDGGTGVDREKVELTVLALGLDWRSRDVRLSADIGHQDHQLRGARPNVTLSGAGIAAVPAAPSNSANFAQPWIYSNERDVFGTVRAEWDITSQLTAWAAAGGRRSTERNSLAGLTVTNSGTGAGTVRRFDNHREDAVGTAELGLRGKLRTGSVGHELVAAASLFNLNSRNAYGQSDPPGLATNLYTPVDHPLPPITTLPTAGGDLDNPRTTTRNRFTSFAIGDTMSFLDDRLLVTLGLRHQRIDTRGFAYLTEVQTSGEKRSHTSPMAGVVWKARSDLSLYANYIESLAQGTTAPTTSGSATVTNGGTQFPAFVSKQKEAGIKYDGGRLRGSLAFFSTAKPAALITSTGAATAVYSIGGEDEHRGVELSAHGEATRGLRVLGGLTWLDAKQSKTAGGTNDGKRVIGVPEWMGNLGVEWDVPALAGLTLEGRVVATSGVYANAANTLAVPSWTRLDLGARYAVDLGGRLVTVRARVNNATDRSYWSSTGGFPGSGYLVVSTPRTFSLTTSVEF